MRFFTPVVLCLIGAGSAIAQITIAPTTPIVVVPTTPIVIDQPTLTVPGLTLGGGSNDDNDDDNDNSNNDNSGYGYTHQTNDGSNDRDKDDDNPGYDDDNPRDDDNYPDYNYRRGYEDLECDEHIEASRWDLVSGAEFQELINPGQLIVTPICSGNLERYGLFASPDSSVEQKHLFDFEATDCNRRGHCAGWLNVSTLTGEFSRRLAYRFDNERRICQTALVYDDQVPHTASWDGAACIGFSLENDRYEVVDAVKGIVIGYFEIAEE